MGELVRFDRITIPRPDEKIYKRLGYRKDRSGLSPKQISEVEKYIDEALGMSDLKGAAVRLRITRAANNKIELESGDILESEKLSVLLRNSREVLLMAATAGRRLAEAIGEDSPQGRLTRAVVFDAVGSEIADAALDWLCDYFNAKLRRENKHLTKRRYSAGYGDFPLENQKFFYDSLKLNEIGVEMNEAFILIPEKSVTALAGIEDV